MPRTSRSAAWRGPRRSPPRCCFWPPRTAASSPAANCWSTAACALSESVRAIVFKFVQTGRRADRLQPAAREPREGLVTVPTSQRGKAYLKTARTLLRAAQTMADRAIADQPRSLADDYQGELGKLLMLMRPNHSLDLLLALNASGAYELMGSFT